MNKELNFLDIINRFSAVKGTGDDCYYSLIDQDYYRLVSTDMLVEGNHFSLEESKWDLVGQKAVTVNVSDIYACGGEPDDLFVSLALPVSFGERDLESLYSGLSEASAYFNVKIRGGDITSTTGPAVISLTIQGKAPKENLLSRSKARVGDRVFVTGALGGAKASGYRIKDRYYRMLPIEKVKLVTAKQIASSMTDISDGLARSLYDIGKSSRVGFVIDLDSIPLSAGANIDYALNGGEDYQFMFTVPAEYACEFEKNYPEIGETVDFRQGITLRDINGEKKLLSSYGYNHF